MVRSKVASACIEQLKISSSHESSTGNGSNRSRRRQPKYLYTFHYDNLPDATTRNSWVRTKEEALGRCDECLAADIRTLYGLSANAIVDLRGDNRWTYQRVQNNQEIYVHLQTQLGWRISVRITEMEDIDDDEADE